jgi:hypothetical protein
MKAQVGDRIILAGEQVDRPTRVGEVVEVRGSGGEPPYVVRWSDGHSGLLYPGPGSVLRVESGAGGTTHAPPPGPVEPAKREWQVRISIFESGDDTEAQVALVADAPHPLSAKGTSHRSSRDAADRAIGDEVAVARALRQLADELLDAAGHDIEARTGEQDVVVRSR